MVQLARQGAADHGADDGVAVERRGPIARHHLAIAQHGDPLGDGEPDPPAGAGDDRDAAGEALAERGIDVVDLSGIRAGDRLNHTTFAQSPAVVQAIGRRLIAGDRVSDGRLGLAETIGATAIGTAQGVGSAIGATANIPAAIVDPVARDRFDLRAHRGAHPRIGALDVLPFVPLGDASLDDAVTLAHRAAGRIWRELGVPSYLYGAAATAEHRTHLADIRRGEFEGLAARLAAVTPEQVQTAARGLDPGTVAMLELRPSGGRK